MNCWRQDLNSDATRQCEALIGWVRQLHSTAGQPFLPAERLSRSVSQCTQNLQCLFCRTRESNSHGGNHRIAQSTRRFPPHPCAHHSISPHFWQGMGSWPGGTSLFKTCLGDLERHNKDSKKTITKLTPTKTVHAHIRRNGICTPFCFRLPATVRPCTFCVFDSFENAGTSCLCATYLLRTVGTSALNAARQNMCSRRTLSQSEHNNNALTHKRNRTRGHYQVHWS